MSASFRLYDDGGSRPTETAVAWDFGAGSARKVAVEGWCWVVFWSANGRRKAMMFDFTEETCSRRQTRKGFVIACFLANISSPVLKTRCSGCVRDEFVFCCLWGWSQNSQTFYATELHDKKFEDKHRQCKKYERGDENVRYVRRMGSGRRTQWLEAKSENSFHSAAAPKPRLRGSDRTWHFLQSHEEAEKKKTSSFERKLRETER